MKRTTLKDDLRSLVVRRSLVVGDFVLSNGKRSDHYFDCKMTTLDSEGAALVGESVLEEILRLPEPVAAIGGLTHGADPIISTVIIQARLRGIPLNGFYVRTEPKRHGTHKLIENAPDPGTNVVIVDDVVTEGGSILKAIDGAKRAGCHVVAAITLVDRLEGGTEKVNQQVPKYISLYTLNDFLPEIERLKRQKNVSSPRPLSAGVLA